MAVLGIFAMVLRAPILVCVGNVSTSSWGLSIEMSNWTPTLQYQETKMAVTMKNCAVISGFFVLKFHFPLLHPYHLCIQHKSLELSHFCTASATGLNIFVHILPILILPCRCGWTVQEGDPWHFDLLWPLPARCWPQALRAQEVWRSGCQSTLPEIIPLSRAFQVLTGGINSGWMSNTELVYLPL